MSVGDNLEVLGEWEDGARERVPLGPVSWSGPSRYRHVASIAGNDVAFVVRTGPGRGLWVGSVKGWSWLNAEDVEQDIVLAGFAGSPVAAFANLREAKKAIEKVLLGAVIRDGRTQARKRSGDG